MGDQFKRFFPGSATLEETTRAVRVEVRDGKPKQLVQVEGVIHQENGSTEKLNEATFETADDPLAILDLFNDFLFVDVSTAEGASDAAAASNDRTNIGGAGKEFNIWVQDTLVPVQILGKHVDNPAG